MRTNTHLPLQSTTACAALFVFGRGERYSILLFTSSHSVSSYQNYSYRHSFGSAYCPSTNLVSTTAETRLLITPQCPLLHAVAPSPPALNTKHVPAVASLSFAITTTYQRHSHTTNSLLSSHLNHLQQLTSSNCLHQLTPKPSPVVCERLPSTSPNTRRLQHEAYTPLSLYGRVCGRFYSGQQPGPCRCTTSFTIRRRRAQSYNLERRRICYSRVSRDFALTTHHPNLTRVPTAPAKQSTTPTQEDSLSP